MKNSTDSVLVDAAEQAGRCSGTAGGASFPITIKLEVKFVPLVCSHAPLFFVFLYEAGIGGGIQLLLNVSFLISGLWF